MASELRWHRLCGRLALALIFVVLGSAQAGLVEDFDGGGTAYAASQNGSAPGPTVTAGGPTGQFLRLTEDGAANQNNSIAFDRVSEPGAFGTVVADLDFRITSGTNPNDYSGADGFSFVLLPTGTYGTAGAGPNFDAEEPNLAGTFGVAFDTWYNWDTDATDNDVSIHWDGQVIENIAIPTGQLNLEAGVFHHAHVELAQLANGSLVTVAVTPGGGGGTVTAIDRFVPNIVPYENRVQITARTGGANEDCDLDNIAVAYSGAAYAVPTVSPTGLYQDFDSAGSTTDFISTQAGSSPGPTISGGGDGNFLRLINDGVNNQVNAIGFDRAADGGVSDSAIVSFDFRANDNEPADGFSMMMLPTSNYGRDGASPLPTNAEKPDVANTLGVGFGVYPFWTGTNNVSLHWNGTELANINVTGVDLNDGDFHRAEVSMVQTTGGSNVSISIIPDAHGTPGAPISVVTDHFLANVFPYDYRVGFAGRTGASNMNVDLDNIASSQLPGAAGPNVSQDFEGAGGTAYEGWYFRDGSPPALLSEPGNTFLRLTHDQGVTENAVAFEKTFDGAAAAIDAQFSLRIGGSQGADGGSFVLLNTGVYGDSGEIPNGNTSLPGFWEEPNLTGTFGVGFDIYPGTSEVSLHWNGAAVANINTITAFGADMRGAGWLAADLSITYDATGAYVTLTETNNSIPIFSNHPIPGMQPYESRVVLGARTGGVVSTIDVDNVNAQFTPGGDFIWITDPGPGNYVDGWNWDIGTSPSSADNAFIPHGQANSTNLSLSGTGSLTINGTGALNESADLNVGYQLAGGPYVLNLGDDGQLTVGGSLWVGREAGASGTVIQTGGDATVNGWIFALGDNATATGRYELSGGTLNVGAPFVIGVNGTGVFNQTGGTVTHTSSMYLADNVGSEGTYNLSGPGVLSTTGELRVGNRDKGTFNMNGGKVTTGSALRLAPIGTGEGIFNMTDGEVRVGSYIIAGGEGKGTFTQSGGTVTQTGGGLLILGDHAGSEGIYDLSGGTLTVNSVSVADKANTIGTFTLSGTGTLDSGGDTNIGQAGDGELNIQGGTATIGGSLWVGHLAGSSGAVTQSSGDVTVNGWILAVGDNGSAAASYELSGGTLTCNTDYVAVGRGGVGHFVQSGDSTFNANVSQRLLIGDNPGADGSTYTMTGGTLDVNNGRELGVGKGSSGAFYQSGGVVNASGRLALATGGGAQPGRYELSGDAVLNVGGDYFLVGQGGQGTFVQSGTSTVNANLGTEFIVGDGGSAVGRYDMSGGTLNVNNGRTLYVGKNGTGTFVQSGGTVNASGRLHVGQAAGKSSLYEMSDGQLNIADDPFVIGVNGQGTFTQTGGTVTQSASSIYLADNVGSEGTYSISGQAVLSTAGQLRVGNRDQGTFRVITGGPTINASQLQTWSGRSTLGFHVANDGVASIDVTNNAALAGHLEMRIHNHIALTAGDSFILVDAGSISGDFNTKDQSVFSSGPPVGSQYIATYDPAQGQGTVEAAVGTGWEIVFPKANQGWVQIDNADSWPTLELLLDIDFNGALPGNDLDALIAYIDEAGFAIEKPEGGSKYDLKLLIGPPTDDSTAFFAWDLSGFDENVGLIGVGANIPEPATLSLLALGALGLLRRRRRRR